MSFIDSDDLYYNNPATPSVHALSDLEGESADKQEELRREFDALLKDACTTGDLFPIVARSTTPLGMTMYQVMYECSGAATLYLSKPDEAVSFCSEVLWRWLDNSLPVSRAALCLAVLYSMYSDLVEKEIKGGMWRHSPVSNCPTDELNVSIRCSFLDTLGSVNELSLPDENTIYNRDLAIEFRDYIVRYEDYARHTRRRMFAYMSEATLTAIGVNEDSVGDDNSDRLHQSLLNILFR